MITVNGREYPLWSQFIEKKDQWIGGTLVDFGDSHDRYFGSGDMVDTIVDITLTPNGDDSAYFAVIGEKFSCGFDVKYGGISGGGGVGWINFSGYGGHQWKIKSKS